MRLLTWAFWATLSLVLMVQLRLLDSGLISPDTPFGIVGYELAFSAERAAAYLTVWQGMGVLDTVRVSLGLDIAFLLAYPAMFHSLIRLLRRHDDSAFDQLGQRVGGAVLWCMLFDAIENLALWRMLDTTATPALSALAGVVASVKFLLVLLAAAWSAAALFRRLLPNPTHA